MPGRSQFAMPKGPRFDGNYLTAKQVAEEWKVSESTIRRWRANGNFARNKVEVVQWGGTWYFKATDVRRYQRQKTSK